MPHLPKCFVYIPSRLNIDIKTNNTHPVATAWTMFETDQDYYGLTYCQFNPYEKDVFIGVTEFLEKYAQNFGGHRLITDFDGITPRLQSVVNLNTDPIIKYKAEFKKFVEKIDVKNK